MNDKTQKMIASPGCEWCGEQVNRFKAFKGTTSDGKEQWFHRQCYNLVVFLNRIEQRIQDLQMRLPLTPEQEAAAREALAKQQADTERIEKAKTDEIQKAVAERDAAQEQEAAAQAEAEHGRAMNEAYGPQG